jgi:hypothetical protein
MQLITIIQEYPIHNVQYITGNKNKVKQVMLVLWKPYAPELAWLKKMLELVALHDVVPQASLHQSHSLAELFLRRRPTCDDMRILFN